MKCGICFFSTGCFDYFSDALSPHKGVIYQAFTCHSKRTGHLNDKHDQILVEQDNNPTHNKSWTRTDKHPLPPYQKSRSSVNLITSLYFIIKQKQRKTSLDVWTYKFGCLDVWACTCSHIWWTVHTKEKKLKLADCSTRAPSTHVCWIIN